MTCETKYKVVAKSLENDIRAGKYADIAVVGCDGIDGALLSVPALTTVLQPVEQIAERAFGTLMSRIRNANRAPCEILLDAPLVIRASSRKGNRKG